MELIGRHCVLFRTFVLNPKDNLMFLVDSFEIHRFKDIKLNVVRAELGKNGEFLV